MDISNQHPLGVLIIVSLGIFIIIIFIRVWFIKYNQDKIIIFRGVLDEVYNILSELPGEEGASIIVILTWESCRWTSTPHSLFFPLDNYSVNGINGTIIIIIELEDHILLQYIGFALLIIFLGDGGIPIFLNVGTEFPHRRRLTISRRLVSRVSKVFFKNIPIIDGFLLVNYFRELGLAAEYSLFPRAFNLSPDHLSCTKRGKE